MLGRTSRRDLVLINTVAITRSVHIDDESSDKELAKCSENRKPRKVEFAEIGTTNIDFYRIRVCTNWSRMF